MPEASLISALLALSVIHLVGAMVPGPNMVVTAHTAASRSARDGLACVAGIVVATLAWVSLTLAGVGVVLQQMGAFYSVLKLVGAAYLVWIGARMIIGAVRQADAGPQMPGALPHGAFRSELLTNLSNPKSAAFWTSVFVVAVPAHAPAWFYAAVIALIGVQTVFWYGLVALAFASPPAQRAYLRISRYVAGAAGTLMVGFGLKLALDAEASAN